MNHRQRMLDLQLCQGTGHRLANVLGVRGFAAKDDAEAEATAAEGEVDEEAEALAGAGPDKEADEPPEAELLEDKANALDLGATTGEDAPPGEELELAPPPPEEACPRPGCLRRFSAAPPLPCTGPPVS